MAKKIQKKSFLDDLFGRNPKKKAAVKEFEDEEFEEEVEYEEFEEEEFEDEEFEDEEFEDRRPTSKGSPEKEQLQINLVDKGDELIAKAIVPGFDDEDVTIDLTREMLTIETEENTKCFEVEGDYLYEEVLYGSFSRSLLLPAEIEVEESYADMKDGILTIHMPKIDRAAHKKLSVKKK